MVFFTLLQGRIFRFFTSFFFFWGGGGICEAGVWVQHGSARRVIGSKTLNTPARLTLFDRARLSWPMCLDGKWLRRIAISGILKLHRRLRSGMGIEDASAEALSFSLSLFLVRHSSVPFSTVLQLTLIFSSLFPLLLLYLTFKSMPKASLSRCRCCRGPSRKWCQHSTSESKTGRTWSTKIRVWSPQPAGRPKTSCHVLAARGLICAR